VVEELTIYYLFLIKKWSARNL